MRTVQQSVIIKEEQLCNHRGICVECDREAELVQVQLECLSDVNGGWVRMCAACKEEVTGE